MDDEIPTSSFIRIGQSLEMPGEIDAEQECIDCVTDWVTRYLGEGAMRHESNGIRIYPESNPIKTIRDQVAFNINETVKYWKRYGSTEEHRNSYKNLQNAYYSLDYDVMTQQWQQYKIRDIARSSVKNRMEDYETYDYGRKGSIFDTWKSNIVGRVCQVAPGGLGYNIDKHLTRNETHGRKFTWGREQSLQNNVIRKYIKCYLDLYLALFPEYSNIQPEFLEYIIYGGSKRKNKKTKKRKINKIKKNKKNKTNRKKLVF